MPRAFLLDDANLVELPRLLLGQPGPVHQRKQLLRLGFAHLGNRSDVPFRRDDQEAPDWHFGVLMQDEMLALADQPTGWADLARSNRAADTITGILVILNVDDVHI